MDSTRPKNVFMTGASGFLGRNLLKRLLEEYPNDRFFLLVRSHATAAFLRNHLSGLEVRDRVVYVGGDVTQPDLGMAASDLGTLMQEVQEIWHLAASTSFDDKQAADIRRTNLEGTRNLLDAITAPLSLSL